MSGYMMFVSSRVSVEFVWHLIAHLDDYCHLIQELDVYSKVKAGCGLAALLDRTIDSLFMTGL